MYDEIDWNVVNKSILNSKKISSGLRAEEVRERLDPELLIKCLHALVSEADACPIGELPRLAFKADIYKTILKKCMPDLRSLEVKENESKHAKLIIRMD